MPIKIAAIRLHRYRLPLRAEWSTAAGGFTVRQGWLLRLTSADGHNAYGDCAPLPASGTETPERAEAALHAYIHRLVGRQSDDAFEALDGLGDGTPVARCAVETALLDLLAQVAGLPLADYLRGRDCRADVAVNAALGQLTQDSGRAMLAARAEGFPVVKFKIGIASPAAEIAHLHRLAERIPAGLLLRLDANRAWDEAQAEGFLAACAGLPIDMLEEPLADPQTDALRRLQAICAFPLALDESLPDFDPDIFLAAPPVRRLVLKPPCLGGLLPALALARRAADAGLECVVTGSVDSACGVLAAGHLAAALGNGLAHGLATSSWLAEDAGRPPTIADGRLKRHGTPGLGFAPWPSLVFSDGGLPPP